MSGREGDGIGVALRAIVELIEWKTAIGAALTVTMGYALFAEALPVSALPPIFAVCLLACGSATLDHLQESGSDALIERTKRRPIPSGRIGKGWALFLAFLFISAGYCTMASIGVHTMTLLALATLAILWRSAVCTALKRVTPFAIIPGALIGAIPPVIGWVSAGGVWWDPFILPFASFLFLWQILHSWRLLLLDGESREKAGLPAISGALSRHQSIRITSIWVLALAVAGILLAGQSDLDWPWHLGMLLASLWLFWSALSILKGEQLARSGIPIFTRIDVYLVVVVVVMTGNAVV